MKIIRDNDTIQIELTDACIFKCSNCTRFCGHKKPFYMTFKEFKNAIDSLEGFPHMVGFQGGEPLLHPEFESFCEYARSKFPKRQLGLWTTFPPGFEHYRESICKTFGNILLNDHSRNDVMHHPVLVPIEEIYPNDPDKMWYLIEHCWAQKWWSASINKKGAWFCEMAGTLSELHKIGEDVAWKVEKDWWKRTPKDYREQMEKFCIKCGLAADLKRRPSTQETDDISPKMYEMLKNINSPKIKKGQYQIHNLQTVDGIDPEDMQKERLGTLATYKEFDYRNNIAKKYGIFLIMNEDNFWTPYLYKDTENKFKKSKYYTFPPYFNENNSLLYITKIVTDEIYWLQHYAKKVDSIVEVGCWKGETTKIFLENCKGTVYAIDNFKGNNDILDATHGKYIPEEIEKMFLNNVGHYPNLKLLKMDSEEAYKLFEPKSIDMVFIDADHDYESVKRDIENWMPISKKIIFGHDYHLPEIQKVLIEKFISDKESDISLKNRYFYFLLDDEKKEELPMITGNDRKKYMISNFRTIPYTTFWCVDIENE